MSEIADLIETIRREELARDSTLAGLMKCEMICRGMSDTQAKEVMDRVQETDTVIADRWNDNYTIYPTNMCVVIWQGVRTEALKYLEETCPKAWFKDMFVSSVPSITIP